MKKTILVAAGAGLFGAVLLCFLAGGCAHTTQARRDEPVDAALWDRVVKRYVTETGRVDYGALRANPGDLERYVAQVAARSPQSHPQEFPTRESQMAYWINAYNALVMKGVADHWPVTSVTKIGLVPWSFFWGRKALAGGQEMTVDNIEGILRKQYGDPRIHFAINCASNSCPRIQREAFTAQNLDALLDAGAREYLGNAVNFRVDAAENKVVIPWIVSHYHEDFEAYVRARSLTGNDQPLLAFIREYLAPGQRAALDALKKPRVKQFSYDWGINDVHAPGPKVEEE